ncbi:MAG: hypothetical protein AAFP83_13955, partial [Bacteroidota bacterium]
NHELPVTETHIKRYEKMVHLVQINGQNRIKIPLRRPWSKVRRHTGCCLKGYTTKLGRIIWFSLWIGSCALAQGQGKDEHGKRLNEHNKRLTHLERLQGLEEQKKDDDLVRRIRYEYEILYNLEVATQSLMINLNTVKSYNLLAQVNNPTSDVLGFRFVDITISNIDDRLVVPESERSRFRQLLNNVFNGFRTLGPAITGASPTLSLFSTILGSVSNFFIVEKKGNKVTNLKPAFKAEEIEAFTEDMRPYISFYEHMYKHNTQLQNNLSSLLKETEVTQLRTKNLIKRAEHTFGYSVNNTSDAKLKELLKKEISNQPDSSKEKFIEASVELKAVIDLVTEVDELSHQFRQMIYQNLEDNLDLVREAADLPVFREKHADPEKLKSLEAELTAGRDLFNQPVVPHLTRMQELSIWLSAL